MEVVCLQSVYEDSHVPQGGTGLFLALLSSIRILMQPIQIAHLHFIDKHVFIVEV